jgi:long-chain fatty acid transport protein
MKKLWAVPLLFAASHATAGGWEASKLDTNFMYQEGGYAELSYGQIDYSDLKGNALYTTTDLKDRKTAKNQTRISGSFKMSYGNLDVGLSSFRSGTIQMQGGAGTYGSGGTVVPDADANLNTTSFVGKYTFEENFSLLFIANQNSLTKTKITTTMGSYDIKAKEVTGYGYGVSYSQPEIALRVELLVQPKSEIKASSSYDASSIASATAASTATALGAAAPADAGYYSRTVIDDANFTSTLSRPETLTLNFQSGVAENTLLFGSIHKAAWSKSQIKAATDNYYSSITSSFSDTTETTIGVARKVSDTTALIASYSSEGGGGKTSTSLFTMSNGRQGISLAARYTMDNLTITGGYSYINVGDVTVSSAASGTTQATYKNNTVSALGLKLGVSF